MIEIKNLTKLYEETEIIKNASYKFPKKGLVCILGHSGCGKTTLMNLISGIDKEYEGEIIVDNVELKTLSENDLYNYRKDYIGFVFQDYNLLNEYSVIENIVYPCVLKSDNLKKDVKKARKILKKMDLSEKANEKVKNLSGGQKQRVAIARALIKDAKIILADEPTGALDKNTSTEIMSILKEISTKKLVILITHDNYICEYADEIIKIKDKQIFIEKNNEKDEVSNEKMILCPPKKINYLKLSYKNFKSLFFRYLLVSFVFSISILCFIFSLSSSNIMEKSIKDFKEKNVAFNNGYIKNNKNNSVYDKLNNDGRIENVYKQYILNDISLSIDDKLQIIPKKYPMPKTRESMSYGVMPRNKKNEIALTPSLAKKFSSKINDLIGKKLILKYDKNEYSLTISGIYNAPYDDFFVSSNIEKSLYKNIKNEPYYSISYDVKSFDDIVKVSDELSRENINTENALKQVKVIQETFSKTKTLFTIISSVILFVCIFIVIIILVKITSTKYKTVGILYSFGFNKNMVFKMIVTENILLTFLVSFVSSLLILISQFLCKIYDINVRLSISEFIITILTSSLIILLVNTIINKKLINTSPDVLLKN